MKVFKNNNKKFLSFLLFVLCFNFSFKSNCYSIAKKKIVPEIKITKQKSSVQENSENLENDNFKRIKRLADKNIHLKLNKQNLKTALELFEVQYSDIVYAQALLESNSFKSINCRSNNNLFGMRFATSRKTLGLRSRGNYAAYSHWIYSVADYKLWQGNKIIRGNYFNYLKARHYFEDINYISKLKGVMNGKGSKDEI